MLRVAGTTTRLAAAFVLVAAVVAGGLASSGCGANAQSSSGVNEGEPIKLGDLLYDVQISRFLNPADDEDQAYLVGQPQPPSDKFYLGVFMQVENEADTPQQLPRDLKVVDTTGAVYKPVPSTSQFALQLGSGVPAKRTLPNAESPAANGPIQGAMVLFLVSQQAIENRPLILEIPSTSGSVGEVTLDI